MILDIYLARRQYGPFCGSPRTIARLARRVQRLRPDCRVVLSPEHEFSASQLAVLHAIADANERACLEQLEADTLQGAAR
jgi:hypothetical protein